ncbi:hypothetical protein VP1G_07896 [Cytospora mali]|uniref:Uncharacterized protein n=1 Tax=Cytospora mali TaxID=578113 RepID=A0A194V9L7_CYTMA|nr:hypothetical protein VP1G_07896 [Valsa mali var. pyri (nom. inval.)]
MAGKKGGAGGGGENSKKAQGQARKAEAAASKKAAEDSKKAAVEEAEWEKGSKKANAKKESEAAKKEEAARKKAEREALLAEEEKNTPGRSAPKNAKTAQKKTRGLDLSQLDDDGSLGALNATGIDNALDALSITNADSLAKIDRHPERRVGGAWIKYKNERIEQLTAEGFFKIKGNNLDSVVKKMRRDFEKSPDNPLNQVQASYNATQEELAEIRAHEKKKVEQRLAEK